MHTACVLRSLDNSVSAAPLKVLVLKSTEPCMTGSGRAISYPVGPPVLELELELLDEPPELELELLLDELELELELLELELELLEDELPVGQ